MSGNYPALLPIPALPIVKAALLLFWNQQKAEVELPASYDRLISLVFEVELIAAEVHSSFD